MSLLLNLALLLTLFGVLGFAADLAVTHIRSVALALRMKLFTLGILLGIVTTLPEFSVGINATLEKAATLSVGNIMGGIVVVFGLILGTSLMLNRSIETDHNLKSLLPSSLIILSPFIFGIDGKFGTFDGVMMILLYLGLIFYLYRLNRSPLDGGIAMVDKGKAGKSLLIALGCLILVILTSHWIIELTMLLLEKVEISKLLIGILLFSIGTNLPEITITFTSWRRKASDLSLSHLVSSAFTNILVLGILAVLHPIVFTIGPVYYALAFFISLIIILFIIFAHSDKRLSRLEGAVLLFVYVLFVATNIFLAGR